MKENEIKFFQICTSNHYIFGLDGEGRIWRRYLLEMESKWVLMENPKVTA